MGERCFDCGGDDFVCVPCSRIDDIRYKAGMFDIIEATVRRAQEFEAKKYARPSDSASEGGTAGNGGTATSEGRALRDEPVPSSDDASVDRLVSIAKHVAKASSASGECSAPVEVNPDEWTRCGGCWGCLMDQLEEAAEKASVPKSTDDAHLHGLHRVERFGDGTYRCLTCESQDKASEAQS